VAVLFLLMGIYKPFKILLILGLHRIQTFAGPQINHTHIYITPPAQPSSLNLITAWIWNVRRPVDWG